MPKQRSALFVLGLATALPAVLVGCSGGSSPSAEPDARYSGTCLESAPSDGKPVAGTAVRNSLEGVTLTFAGYGGDFQDAQKSSFTDPFAECTGATVLQDSVDSAKLRAMVQAGDVSWDVVYAGQGPIANACGELATDVDTSKVDVEDLDSGLMSPCQVPLDVEPSFTVYNTEMFGDSPPTSMADFFDTQKYPGKRLIFGKPSETDYPLWGQIARMLGWTEASGDPFPHEQVLDKLASIKNDLVYYQTGAEQVQRLEQADVAFASTWAARVYAAAQNGAPFETLDVPAYGNVDAYVPQGVKNSDAAFALLNYMMGPAQQAALTETSVYGPTNSTSNPQVPDDMRPWVLDQAQLKEAMNVSTPLWLSKEMTDQHMADRQQLLVG